MDKISLSRITAFADSRRLEALAGLAAEGEEVRILKEPEKTMVLLRVREPVRGEDFYLGEMLAVHCTVELGGVRGAAVIMGDDLAGVRAAAVIDALHSGGFPGFALIEGELLRLGEEREEGRARQAALVRGTQVIFQALEDREL
ncbi:MAG: phosphonate C-P lyase system protein PhnG [Spirochaetaceae bacterium]|jgi:alpha-D-ribose 1-methylphosphonate 5-triphosphate synthase subunit PhnG|nr:phosphonate C-P lyase system protein PhnG [Spirochaetaceae bacterium]